MSRDRLIIFDCDGVLVDSEPLAALAYARAYARHGMAIKPEVVSHGVGLKQADIILKIGELTGHYLPEHGTPDIWLETKAIFSEQLQPTPGLPEFLDGLSVARCVGSSSSPERIRLSLAVTGIGRHFGEAVYSSSMVDRGKPAPDLFLFAARKMGIAPDRCVVIEDSRFGVQGAIAAGMTAIGYTGGAHTTPEHGPTLREAGAHAVHADWKSISAELAGRGFI